MGSLIERSEEGESRYANIAGIYCTRGPRLSPPELVDTLLSSEGSGKVSNGPELSSIARSDLGLHILGGQDWTS